MALENNKEIIKLRWSNQVIVITTIVSFIIIATLFFLIKYATVMYIKIPIIAFLSILSLFFIAKAPMKLILSKDEICIKQMLRKTIIKIDDVVDISPVCSKVILESEREFGSAGFCGYLGSYYNKDLGKYKLFATEMDNLILIKMKNEQYILSCNSFLKIKSLFQGIK